MLTFNFVFLCHIFYIRILIDIDEIIRTAHILRNLDIKCSYLAIITHIFHTWNKYYSHSRELLFSSLLITFPITFSMVSIQPL